MPNANGHCPQRAALYIRVSSDEQAKKGYSIPDQLRDNRIYAEREGIEIVEEVIDDGYSGASPDRPGLRRIMELAEAGAINLVLATKRDRFFRSRLYRLLWDRDLAEQGVRLVALNDTGNRFGDAMQDEFAEWEKEEIARRTGAGRRQKAREGKLVATHTPHYGFRYDADRTSYVMHEEEMRVVRQIFELVGMEGVPMRGVKRKLEAAGIPAPKGGKYWHQTFIRRLILDDAYKPHTYSEMKELVRPEVAERLAEDRCYGIVWWEGQIAVPIPDAGLSPMLVDSARGRIAAGRDRSPSTAGRRFWQLSGGIIRCGGCGYVMQNQPTKSGNGTMYYYYRCSHAARNGREACPESRMRRAPQIEAEVWSFVRGLLTDPEELRKDLERMIELEREEARGGHVLEDWAYTEQLAEVERKRAGYLDLAATGRMTYAELDDKLAELEGIRQTAERELQALKERTQRLEQLEKDKDELLEYYAALAPKALDALSPEERHHLYGMLRLSVVAHIDDTLEVSGLLGEVVCTLSPRSSSRPLSPGIWSSPRSTQTMLPVPCRASLT